LVKFELGLFERPFSDEALLPLVGCGEHRELAREAVRRSLVLLKNDDDTLPLSRDASLIFVAGQAADDIGIQCGGWTIEWQGEAGNVTPGTTILEGVESAVSEGTTIFYNRFGKPNFDGNADVGIVVLGEAPYAEGFGDGADLTLSETDLGLIARVRERSEKLVVILLSGRPLIVAEHLDQWDAFVAAWLPGTEGQGVADVLFGGYGFTGKLPYTWPRSMGQVPYDSTALGEPLFPFGYGLYAGDARAQ
jgi:beta-glucosidase